MLKKEVLETLESTPEKIRREIAGLLPRHLKARPAPNKWSIQEILAHLDDVEELGMRARVAAMIEEDEPLLLPFDQEKRAVEQKYNRRNRRTRSTTSRASEGQCEVVAYSEACATEAQGSS